MGRPHGVCGEVRVFLHNPNSTNIVTFPVLYIKQETGVTKVQIVHFRTGARCSLAHFDGIKTREAAEKLKGKPLLVSRDDLPAPDDDEFYVADLIGLAAYNGDVTLGEITSSRPQGGIEVVTVAGEKEALEIPLVEDFVAELNIEGGKVVFKNIEDLPRYPVRPRQKK